MKTRALSLLFPFALLALPQAAQAQDPFLDMLMGKGGRRVSANPVDEDYGDALGATLGLGVVSIDGLDHPAEDNPQAGETIEGTGREVRFKNLVFNRIRFSSPEAADALAELIPFSRVDGASVTTVQGKDASAALLEHALDAVVGDDFSENLGERIDRVETSRGPTSTSVGLPKNRPRFSGVIVWLAKKIMVVRLNFDAPGVARSFLENDVKTDTPTRMIGDVKGNQLVMVRGRALEDVHLAKKVLKAAWATWGKGLGKRHTIAVFAPTDFDGQLNFVAYTTENGDLYQTGANMIRKAREHLKRSRSGQGGIEWTFLDPKTRNHVVFKTKEFYGGAVVRPNSMFVAINPTKKRCGEERAYFAELLRGIDFELPPKSKKGMLRLLDPPGK